MWLVGGVMARLPKIRYGVLLGIIGWYSPCIERKHVFIGANFADGTQYPLSECSLFTVLMRRLGWVALNLSLYSLGMVDLGGAAWAQNDRADYTLAAAME